MNKIQTLYLSVVILIYLAVIVILFFAATDSKNTLGLSAVAVFFALIGIFWVYRFVKERKTH